MIPTAAQLQQLSEQSEGSLSKVPFAVLLRALAVHERTAVLEIRRKQFLKRIVLEHGVPVDCQSNLVHERLGRFMVAQGKLTETDLAPCLSESIAREVPLGEILVQKGIVGPNELYRTLQQNLAKKLLDLFTWSEGEFRMLSDMPEVWSPLKVKVPQLIVTGVTRFAPQQEVDGTVLTLVGKRLALHPQPPVALDELKLTGAQRKLAFSLQQPRNLSELAQAVEGALDEVGRFVYSLGILGVVTPEDQLPAAPKAPDEKGAAAGSAVQTTTRRAAPPPTGASERVAPIRTPVATEAEKERLTDELMQVYLSHRRQDPFDFFGLPEDASQALIRARYLEFGLKFAPWRLEGPDQAPVVEKAEDLFLYAAQAYAQLADSEQRNTLLYRRKTLREKKSEGQRVGPAPIKTDLLDSEAQYAKGRALMEAGQHREALQFIEFASDCDPQNALYRTELAWCRFLSSPGNAAPALEDLRAARRMDPKCGLAFFYAGEILRDQDDFDEAEKHLQRAIKLMAPDRRPIEALKSLTAQRKRKR